MRLFAQCTSVEALAPKSAAHPGMRQSGQAASDLKADVGFVDGQVSDGCIVSTIPLQITARCMLRSLPKQAGPERRPIRPTLR